MGRLRQGASRRLSACFVNPLAIERDLAGTLGLAKTLLPVGGTRKLKKRDMLRNDACPKISVDPQTFDVFVDGVACHLRAGREVPLAQRYMLR